MFFFFNDTATTESYTYDTLFPYTTLFRSCAAASRRFSWSRSRSPRASAGVPAVSSRAEASERVSVRSEEHTSELQSLMRISYAVFCLKKKKKSKQQNTTTISNYQTSQ